MNLKTNNIMKKLLLITALVTVLSCSNENEQQEDCNCDRVVETNYVYFNMVGGGFWAGHFITINDCTGVQRQWNIDQYGMPSLNSCQ